MEKLELKTSKGEWLLVDLAGEDLDATVTHIYNTKVCSDILEVVCKLSEITEEQASEVVECSIHTNLFAHYVNEIPVNTYCYKSSIESLHSLLKSKGIHLFKNPAPLLHHSRLEAEANTFYNPILFKKL